MNSSLITPHSTLLCPSCGVEFEITTSRHTGKSWLYHPAIFQKHANCPVKTRWFGKALGLSPHRDDVLPTARQQLGLEDDSTQGREGAEDGGYGSEDFEPVVSDVMPGIPATRLTKDTSAP